MNFRICIFFLLVSLTACHREEIDIVDVEIKTPDPKIFQDNSHVGKVINKNGQGLANAHVSISGILYGTDQAGNFQAVHQKSNANGSLIKCTAPGFLDAFKFVKLEANEVGNTDFEMLPIPQFIEFLTDEETRIQINDEITLKIEAETFVSTGSITDNKARLLFYAELATNHSGVFPVNMPVEDMIFDPGSYFLYLHFKDFQGNQLEMKKPVSISFNSDVFQHPVKAYRVDEQNESWTGRSDSRIEDNHTTLTISESGYFGIGKLNNSGLVKIQVADNMLIPVLNAVIEISTAQDGLILSQMLSQSGRWEGYLEKGKSYNLHINNGCGEIIYHNSFSFDQDEYVLAPIQIEGRKLIYLNYDLNPCEDHQVTVQDQIFVHMLSENNLNFRYLANSNSSSIAIASCNLINEIGVFQSHKLIWREGIQLIASGQELQRIDLILEDACFEQIAGWVIIDGKSKVYSVDDIIMRRTPGTNYNLEIADLAQFSFAINVENVSTNGIYAPETLVFNTPVPLFCQGEGCSFVELNIRIPEDNSDLMRVSISGTVSNVQISGFFENTVR
jgi:hypothetical protein